MKDYNYKNNKVLFFDNDISDEYTKLIKKIKVVAWDIETSGLNWRMDEIGICQLFSIGSPIIIIKINKTKIPRNLCSLLCDNSLRKIFHHALFDLRFMSYKWKIFSQNISCTKIASKLLNSKKNYKHSLKVLLNQYLGIQIEKKEQFSNWLSVDLTKNQIVYAIEDVIYLISLMNELEIRLQATSHLELAHSCFAFIPLKVQLDILGYKNIYSY